MDYISKIQKVRENIREWQKEHGNEFSYMILGFQSENEITGEISTIISPVEHEEIVEYLARRKFIEIIKKAQKSCKIKILPKANPIIKLKTLELIARELKDHYTGYEIDKLLEECGIEKKFIIPNSKWLIFYKVFEELSISQDKKARELLYKIICEGVHPLNLSGNTEMSDTLVKKFNEYLKYDNLGIFYSEKEQKYEISNISNLIEVSEEEVLQEFSGPLIEEILPDINKGTFSEKVIELVVQTFNNNLSNSEIRKIITPVLNKNEPISKEPFIKGYIDDLTEEYSWLYNLEKILKFIKRKDEKADRTTEEIIEILLHPLNYNADEEKAERIAERLEKYLRYDNFYIQNTGKEYMVSSEAEMEEMHTPSPEFEEQEKQSKTEDEEKIKQSKEIIIGLRDSHQAYIDILEIFCRDPKKPTKELNDAYLFLSNKIEKTIKKLDIKTYRYQIFFYRPFKNDLYSAEIEWLGREIEGHLSWDEIRPSLYKVHSDIIKMLNMAEKDNAMTDEEKKLDSITRLISKKRTQKNTQKEIPQTMKIEISKMPDLNVRNVEDNTITKGKKKIHLPKFKPTDWSKIEIRFLDERNVLITADKKDVVPADYEMLGFSDDKKNKPNTAWAFLLGLAKNNGETIELPKPIPDNIRQQKLSLSQKLKAVFKNETEPFYDLSETQSYRIKIKLIPPPTKTEDKFGTAEYLEETMVEKFEE